MKWWLLPLKSFNPFAEGESYPNLLKLFMPFQIPLAQDSRGRKHGAIGEHQRERDLMGIRYRLVCLPIFLFSSAIPIVGASFSISLASLRDRRSS